MKARFQNVDLSRFLKFCITKLIHLISLKPILLLHIQLRDKRYTIYPSVYIFVLTDKQEYFIFIDFPRMFLLIASSLLLRLIWILFQYMCIHKDEKCKTILLEILILNLKLLRINCLFKKSQRGNSELGCSV